jgi:hypothetical protein
MTTDTAKITLDQQDAINDLERQIAAMLHLGCVGGLGGMREDIASDYMAALESKFEALMVVVREIVDQDKPTAANAA